MAGAKIAVIGDVNGQFRAVLQKLTALHSKNAFSLALIIGNLFADPEISTEEDSKEVQDLINGNVHIPLPVYFALRSHALPEAIIERLKASSDDSVCSNLYFLGKRTSTKTSEGIKIVTLGGMLDADVAGDSKDKYLPFYTQQDAKILKGQNRADILITSQWPSDVISGSKVSIGEHEEPASQPCLAELSETLKPRYHFSASPDFFFEREPFFHAPKQDEPSPLYPITRFLSLASYGNQSKQKWIYAFTLDPKSPHPNSVPTGTTASPFSFSNRKRAALPSQQDALRYSNNGDPYARPSKRHKKGRDKGPPPTQAECYFCLSNPNLPEHLVTTIAAEAYLTTAKGPLPKADTFPSLGFPGHMLIIPMTHAPTLSLIPDDDSRTTTLSEMTRFRTAIQGMYASRSNGKIGAVAWEISKASGFHAHWQILPLPADMIKKGLVEAALKVEAENKSHPHLEKGEPDESTDYYRVWTYYDASPPAAGGKEPSKSGSEKSLWFPLDAGFRDLQFARRVCAKLLGLEGRTMWQDCGQTQTEEAEDASAFQKAFGEGWDFTAEG